MKFGSLDKMSITYSEPKDNLGRSGKGLITYLVFKTKARSNKYKKARYAIKYVGKKDLSEIIREFEKLPMKLMRGRGRNMSLMTVTFDQQDSL